MIVLSSVYIDGQTTQLIRNQIYYVKNVIRRVLND